MNDRDVRLLVDILRFVGPATDEMWIALNEIQWGGRLPLMMSKVEVK